MSGLCLSERNVSLPLLPEGAGGLCVQFLVAGAVSGVRMPDAQPCLSMPVL